jgi:3-dehydroquinate dehydratase type I
MFGESFSIPIEFLRPQTGVTVREQNSSTRDLIELRLDSVTDPSAAGALKDRRKPVIVTCRPVWEGGGFTGSEEDRRRILAEALNLGAEYVDVEWRAKFDDLHSDCQYCGDPSDSPSIMTADWGYSSGIA